MFFSFYIKRKYAVLPKCRLLFSKEMKAPAKDKKIKLRKKERTGAFKQTSSGEVFLIKQNCHLFYSSCVLFYKKISIPG